MKKRNLFLLVVTALIAFAFFNVKNVKTVKANADTQAFTKGIPEQFKGIWVGAFETSGVKKYPNVRTAFTMDTKPYGRELAYFNKNWKYAFGSKFIKMFDPSYKKIGENTYDLKEHSGYNKSDTKNEEIILHFIGSKKLTFQFVDPKTGKSLADPIDAHKYSYKKAHKLLTQDYTLQK